MTWPSIRGDLEFEGRFAAPDMSEVATDVHSVRWRDAVLALGVSDVSGLKTAASLLIDGGTDSRSSRASASPARATASTRA